MRLNSTRRWDADELGPLSEGAVRALYQGDAHRVSVMRYPAGASFTGATRRALCYVLAGSARCSAGAEMVVMAAGDIGEIGEGEYSMEVVGNEDLVVALCWEIPPEYRRRGPHE